VLTAVSMKDTVFWVWGRVALARIDVSEEHVASIFRVERISELGTTLQWPLRIFSTLKIEATCSSETTVLTRPTRHNIEEDSHSHCRESFKSYIPYSVVSHSRKQQCFWNKLKNAVFWDVTPCGSCKNRRFEGTYRLHHQVNKNQRAGDVSSN
jgi:hypothetical protein